MTSTRRLTKCSYPTLLGREHCATARRPIPRACVSVHPVSTEGSTHAAHRGARRLALAARGASSPAPGLEISRFVGCWLLPPRPPRSFAPARAALYQKKGRRGKCRNTKLRYVTYGTQRTRRTSLSFGCPCATAVGEERCGSTHAAVV